MPPVVSLAPIDWAVVVVFLACILALGFSARLRENTVLQFLAAGRNLTLPAFVATLVCTWYGGILGIGESVSFFGFGTWLLMGVPYYVFALYYARYMARNVRAADQISIPERLASQWGRNVGLAAAGLIFLLAVPAAHVLMLGTLVQTLTGWGLFTSILAATVVGTLFLYKGGLLADVRASLLAFTMMYLGFGLIVAWCLVTHPFAATMATVENKDFLTLTGGSSVPAIVSYFILGAWTIVDPGFHQRAASAQSPQTAQNGIYVSVFFWLLFDVLSITTGMYALALLKPMPENTLQIFPLFGQLVLPPGLRAVFLCGMLGTITSAMVGYSLVSGATFGREMLARIKGEPDDARVKQWTRYGIALGSIVAIVLAMGIDSVVGLWYLWSGSVVGALLIPVVASYRGRLAKMPSGVVLASMLLSFLVSFGWLIYGRFGYRFLPGRTKNDFLEVVLNGQTFSLGTLAPGLAVSALVLALGSLMGGKRKG